MNTDFIKGVVVPILTIVDENEKIDEAKQREYKLALLNLIASNVLGLLAVFLGLLLGKNFMSLIK